MAIDRKWFLEKLDQPGKSQRGLAKILGKHPSMVTKLLNGERRIQPGEPDKIARYLNVLREDVDRHLGETPDDTPRISLVSTIDEGGELKPLRTGTELPESVLMRAESAVAGQSGELLAAQVRAGIGSLSMLDDSLVVYRQPHAVDPAAVGVLSIIKLREGVTMLAKLEKARKTGEATIETSDGKTREVEIEAATPVLVMLP